MKGWLFDSIVLKAFPVGDAGDVEMRGELAPFTGWMCAAWLLDCGGYWREEGRAFFPIDAESAPAQVAARFHRLTYLDHDRRAYCFDDGSAAVFVFDRGRGPLVELLPPDEARAVAHTAAYQRWCARGCSVAERELQAIIAERMDAREFEAA